MKHIFKILSFLFSSILLLSACEMNEEVWTGKEKNPIQVVCGKQCSTIQFCERSNYLTPEARAQIQHFVRTNGCNRRVFVSPCLTNPKNLVLDMDRYDAVRAYIRSLGYAALKVNSTYPSDMMTRNCMNLVRGKLGMYVRNCPNNTISPSVQTIGTSFGCTSNYNLAQMIIDPWNLLARGGDNGTEGARVAIGSKNYREGKQSKLDMESSS